jgi:hypothetical protein
MSVMNNVINTFYVRALLIFVVWTEILMNLLITDTIPLVRNNVNRHLTWGVTYNGYYRVLTFVSRKQFRKAKIKSFIY